MLYSLKYLENSSSSWVLAFRCIWPVMHAQNIKYKTKQKPLSTYIIVEKNIERLDWAWFPKFLWKTLIIRGEEPKAEVHGRRKESHSLLPLPQSHWLQHACCVALAQEQETPLPALPGRVMESCCTTKELCAAIVTWQSWCPVSCRTGMKDWI